MRTFRSVMTVLAFTLMGGGVLTGTWPQGQHGSRYPFIGEWIDGMVAGYGPQATGWGLIVFGVVFAALWMAVGHDR